MPEKKKRWLTKKRLSILLIMIAGVLAVTASVVFRVQWNEGAVAQKNAQALLASSGIKKPAPSPEETVPDAYIQPEAPDVNPEMTGAMDTEFEGYAVIARLDIEKIGLALPVLSETSDDALKISVCYYTGPEPGGIGNLVITGHNYRNGAHFGKLDQLSEGDTVLLTDLLGITYTYTVYKREQITPDNPEALEKTEHERELTLVTCEANGNRRLLMRCYLTGSSKS